MRALVAFLLTSLLAFWVLLGTLGGALVRHGLPNIWIGLATTTVVLLVPPFMVGRWWSRRQRTAKGTGLSRRGWADLLVVYFVVATLVPLGFGYQQLGQVLLHQPRYQLSRLLDAFRSDQRTAAPRTTVARPEKKAAGPTRRERRRARRPKKAKERKARKTAAPVAQASTLSPSRAVFTKTFAGDGTESARATSAPGGGIVMGGVYSKALVLGKYHLPAVRRTGSNGFVTLLSAAGKVRWAKAYDHATVNDVAVDSAGNVYVGGSYTRWSSTFDKGGTCVGGARHLFVTKLTPDGQEQWALSGVRKAQLTARRLAVTPSGEVYLAGWFGPGSMTIAGTTLTTRPQQRPGYFGKISASGRFSWVKQLAPFGAGVDELALTQSGDLVMAGTFERGLLTLGSTALVNISLDKDVFVAKFDRGGQTKWARRYGGRRSDRVGGLAAGRDGGATLAMSAERGPLHTARGELETDTRFDTLIVSLDSKGQEHWTHLVAGRNSEVPRAVTIDTAGHSIVAGFTYSKQMRMGSLGYARRGNRDIYLLRIAPDGASFWAERLMGGMVTPAALVAQPGSVLLLGRYGAPGLTLDSENRAVRGPIDLFLTRRTIPIDAQKITMPTVRSKPTTPGSVFRTTPVPKNPRLDQYTHAYLRDIFLWLGMMLKPVDLDPLRRLLTATDQHVSETKLRLFASDTLVRTYAPAVLRAAGLPDLARTLAAEARIDKASRAAEVGTRIKAATDGLKSGKFRPKERHQRFALWSLFASIDKALKLDAEPKTRRTVPGALTHQGSQHAAALGGALAYGFAVRADERSVARAHLVSIMKSLIAASGAPN